MKHIRALSQTMPMKADTLDKQRGGEGKTLLCCTFSDMPALAKLFTPADGCRCG